MADPPARNLVGDIALTGFLLVAGLASLPFLTMWWPASRPVDSLAVVLVVLAASSGMVRRFPVISFAVATGATSLYLLLDFAYGFVMLSVAFASYGLGRRLRLRCGVTAAVAGVLVLLVHLFTNSSALDGLLGLVPGSAWIVVPFTIGMARRLTVEAAERQRAAAERRALDDERLRLASEVHDIVGHGLAAIQMQADIARHMRERRNEPSDAALDAISRASADALAELRATLATIAPEGATTSRDSRAPTPGLHRVADLCERMRESGIVVDLTELGRRHSLSPAADVAAYRVLQESLTNVAKHSSSRRTKVQISYSPTAVELEIVNAATSTGPICEGFGISGMARRVTTVGGTFAATAEHGEFRIAATIPVAQPG